MCRSWRAASVLVFALTSIASAEAKDPDWYLGIIGKDDRQLVETTEPPWGAIGQINVSGASRYKWCTGTLVAPTLVLTAAHCLVNFLNHKPFTPEIVHFNAGVQRDKNIGHSVAKCLLFPEDYNKVVEGKYRPEIFEMPLENYFYDIGAIVLADPIPVESLPVSTTAFGPGLPLMYAAYMDDHRYALAADRGCKLVSVNQGLWQTTCDTHGSSGGPILVTQGDRTFVAAIMVGIIRRTATLAVPVSVWKDLPKQGECP